jgi:hypothetical protein
MHEIYKSVTLLLRLSAMKVDQTIGCNAVNMIGNYKLITSVDKNLILYYVTMYLGILQFQFVRKSNLDPYRIIISWLNCMGTLAIYLTVFKCSAQTFNYLLIFSKVFSYVGNSILKTSVGIIVL